MLQNAPHRVLQITSLNILPMNYRQIIRSIRWVNSVPLIASQTHVRFIDVPFASKYDVTYVPTPRSNPIRKRRGSLSEITQFAVARLNTSDKINEMWNRERKRGGGHAAERVRGKRMNEPGREQILMSYECLGSLQPVVDSDRTFQSRSLRSRGTGYSADGAGEPEVGIERWSRVGMREGDTWKLSGKADTSKEDGGISAGWNYGGNY